MVGVSGSKSGCVDLSFSVVFSFSITVDIQYFISAIQHSG